MQAFKNTFGISRTTAAAFLVAAVAAVVPAFGQAKPATPPPAPTFKYPAHSDTTFARELLRLNQPDLIKAGVVSSKGTGVESMWKAQAQVATWDEILKNRGELPKATQDYLASLKTYLNSPSGATVDGNWALDHAKFIFARLSEPIINRMEYWANGPKDREQLAPMAQLADQLLKTADTGLNAEMEFLGTNAGRTKFTSEEAYNAAYMRCYGATVEVKYYNAWAKYFLAMSLEPGGGSTSERNKLLAEAVETLSEFADAAEDNGVIYQSKLLRGKALSESNQTAKAVENFTGAQNPAAPGWVQYQAKYQTVVAQINARDFEGAKKSLAAFKAGLPKDNVEAQMSAEMLGYRVAWAEAEATTDAAAKTTARLNALKILSAVIERDPRFRDLVYDQLAAQIPDGADLTKLMPMQQLALAYSKSQGQKGDTPKSREALQEAINASSAVMANKNATPAEQLEGLYLVGVCNAVLGKLDEAARYNLDFAERAPKDPRSKALIQLAMEQIGQLRQIARGNTSPELKELQERGLRAATSDPKNADSQKWFYAQGVTLEEAGKYDEAYKAFDRVAPEDRNYLDARYRLISVTLQRLKAMTGKAPDAEIRAAASDLFKACSKFVSLLDNPPKTVPPEAIEKAKAYRTDIWLIEVDAALNPVVKDSKTALDRLDKLESMRDKLPAKTQGALLRYKIQAYQQGGQSDKAIEVIKIYASSQGSDAAGTIANFVYSLIEEIGLVEKRDPAEAQKLASYAVDLLGELIKSAETDEKMKKNIYEFRVLQSDMMVRAHRTKEAVDLAKKLQEEKPAELINFMTEARAIYTEGMSKNDPKKLAEAQDYFIRILPKLEIGKPSFWEAWLRIIQCKEAIGGASAAPEIKKALGDLKGFHGNSLGGEKYKDEFAKLLLKYGVN